jgi:calcineurin-like phosphoesterase family protein
MKTYITSDLHFGHTNILKYNPDTRVYKDVATMNAKMIREWNETVGQDDLVYILGDVAFCNERDAVAIMQQLAGRKILVKGNHDSKLVQDSKFVACFESIHDYLTVNYSSARVGKCRVALFHYPVLEWDQCHRGAVHFHGHVHGKPTGMERYRVRDVGMDATGRVVSSMDDMILDALKGEIKRHGDGQE